MKAATQYLGGLTIVISFGWGDQQKCTLQPPEPPTSAVFLDDAPTPPDVADDDQPPVVYQRHYYGTLPHLRSVRPRQSFYTESRVVHFGEKVVYLDDVVSLERTPSPGGFVTINLAGGKNMVVVANIDDAIRAIATKPEPPQP